MLRNIVMVVMVVFLLCITPAGVAGVSDDAPPTLTEACGSQYANLTAETVWVRTADGVRLYVVEAGTGKTTIVLAHGGISDACNTLPFATKLIEAGYRIVAPDFRGAGFSDKPFRNRLAFSLDFAAVVARARAMGAERVFLIGSSRGGAAIVQNTASLRVEGRISLSGMRLWRGYGINNQASVARIREPFLYVGTRNDRRSPVKEVFRIFRRIGAADKRTAFYPGTAHGFELVEYSRFAPLTRDVILRWLSRH